MIETVGNSKILRTSYPNTSDLYLSIADKLKNVTEQPNKLLWFIENGICSYHNESDEGRELYRWSELKNLVEFLKDNIKEYLGIISVNENDVAVTGMWANRYPPGTFIVKHNHNYLNQENSIIIGIVYYIRKDDTAGSLVIDIPNYGEYNTDMHEGDIIIFDSTLEHWTVPNQSDTDKYTIGLEIVVGDNGVKLNET
jgi:hypothetical protein